MVPSKITRSRKIQLRNFESESLSIEYTIELLDNSLAEEALKEANKKANEYLDREERRLRKIKSIFSLEISEEGQKIGGLQIRQSDDKQYENYIHVWRKHGEKELYIGYLHRLTGEFKFKEENMDEINKIGLNFEKHFIVRSE